MYPFFMKNTVLRNKPEGGGGSGLHDVCMTELIWDTVYKGKPIVGGGSGLHDDFA